MFHDERGDGTGTAPLNEPVAFYLYEPALSTSRSGTATWTAIPAAVPANEPWSLATGDPHPSVFALDDAGAFDRDTPANTPLAFVPPPTAQVNGIPKLVGNLDQGDGRIFLVYVVNAGSTLVITFSFDVVDAYTAESRRVKVISTSDADGEWVAFSEVAGTDNAAPHAASGIFRGRVTPSTDRAADASGDGSVWVKEGDELTIAYYGEGGAELYSDTIAVGRREPTSTATPTPTSGHANADEDGHANADEHGHADADEHGHANADEHAHTDADEHGHADANEHGHADADEHGHANADEHSHASACPAHRDRLAHAYAHTQADEHAHTYADEHGHADADEHTHARAHAYAQTDADTHTHARAHAYAQIDADTHTDAHVYAQTDTHTHTHTHAHAYAQTDADADTHAHAYAQTDADEHAHTDAHVYAQTDADAHTHAHAHTDGDQHAHANVDQHPHTDGDQHAHANVDQHPHTDGDQHIHACADRCAGADQHARSRTVFDGSVYRLSDAVAGCV